jgi:hypothetical protein
LRDTVFQAKLASEFGHVGGNLTLALDFVIWLAGVLSAISALFQFVLTEQQKNSLRSGFEARVYKFNYVTWPNFARMEATAALGVMDRFFGRHFFSRKRLLATIAVLTLAAMTAAALGNFDWRDIARFNPFGQSDFATHGQAFGSVMTLSTLILLGVSFALSVTVTRAVSVVLLKLPSGTKSASTKAFALLLLFHLMLLVLWYPIADHLNGMLWSLLYILQQAVLGIRDDWTLMLQQAAFVVASGLADMGKEFVELAGGKRDLWRPLSWLWQPAVPALHQKVDVLHIWFQFEVFSIVATVANGARIIFALCFFLIYLLAPSLKAIATSLVRQPKPIAPLVFGGIAAGALLLQKGLKFL